MPKEPCGLLLSTHGRSCSALAQAFEFLSNQTFLELEGNFFRVFLNVSMLCIYLPKEMLIIKCT